MKRLGFVLTLFLIAFLLTHCKDECEDYGGCGCGGSSGPTRQITGMTNFETNFFGDSTAPALRLIADYRYAVSKPRFSLINSAYACSPAIELSDFGTWVDSIKVVSIPQYNNKQIETQLQITNYNSRQFLLSDFNRFVERDFKVESYSTKTLKLLEKPSQSDSFTFSFYYYKDGAIIDSSFTQKFYISQ